MRLWILIHLPVRYIVLQSIDIRTVRNGATPLKIMATYKYIVPAFNLLESTECNAKHQPQLSYETVLKCS